MTAKQFHPLNENVHVVCSFLLDYILIFHMKPALTEEAPHFLVINLGADLLERRDYEINH